jgi:hypothetical protein
VRWTNRLGFARLRAIDRGYMSGDSPPRPLAAHRCLGPFPALRGSTIYIRQYVGRPYAEPESLNWGGAWSNAVLAGGLGRRALSLVDLACWDLAARPAGQPIAT